ncbi:MAG: amidohydrolase family protein, partial [bacterium]
MVSHRMPGIRATGLVWMCAAFAVAAGAQAPPSAPATTILRAARLLDVKSGTVSNDAYIIVEGDHIKAVGSGAATASGARVIDLGNVTLLPGLIDTHTHLLQNYNGRLGGDDENMLNTVATMSPAARALLGAQMAREDLEAGITAVRDLGNSGWNGDVALRDAINKGYVVGPRMQVSTRALSAAGGQFGELQPAAQALVEQEYAVVSTPDEARRAVRQAFYDGADLIKVIVNTGSRVVSLEEMKAIVEEARRVGKRVAAHAIGDTAT